MQELRAHDDARPDCGGDSQDREQLRIESSADLFVFGLGFLAMRSKVKKPCSSNGLAKVSCFKAR